VAAGAETIVYPEVHRDLWRPLKGASRRYIFVVSLLAAISLWGLFAWSYQLARGIGVAGINRPVFWAFYLVDFVFWIGISHAGTLISAILRLTEAGWRRPVTRAAEAITVFALMIGGMFPIIHLGRAWLFFWLFPYPNSRLLWPNFRSPLMWDLTAISTYLIGSSIYLFLPLIPDVAALARHSSGWRVRLYRALSLGWTGSDQEWHALERAMKLMAGIILAVAVSVHTVVAWDFSMAIAPMWHSTIFGPYFVVGAIFSGIAALVIAMAIIRKSMHLERYLTPHHFNNLGKLLLLMSLLWVYFTVSENLTAWYGNEPKEMNVFGARVRGPFAPYFWIMVVCNFIVPLVLLGIRKLRSVRTVTIASITVIIGMWLERFLIIIPTLSFNRLTATWGRYAPTWVEISITTATFASMGLLYLIFAKLFPIVSIWEFEDDTVEGNA
jgi:molybdopterin-containing oxidoreductase family membrane subunit